MALSAKTRMESEVSERLGIGGTIMVGKSETAVGLFPYDPTSPLAKKRDVEARIVRNGRKGEMNDDSDVENKVGGR